MVGIGSQLLMKSPLVILYKLNPTKPSYIISRYRHRVTTGPGKIMASFWNPQGLLINPSTNSMIFHFFNYNDNPPAPKPLYSGMYYLYINTNGCIGPFSIGLSCPPIPANNPPTYAVVYKHYS